MEQELATVVPTILLEKYCSGGGLQLCYASVAQKEERYLEFYADRSKKGDMVLLDHSPKVPRAPVSPDLLVEMIGRIGPRAVVLPNMDLTPEKTVSLSEAFVSEHAELTEEVEFIGMLQGYDMESLGWCSSRLAGMCEYLGLPASVEKVEKRHNVIEELGITNKAIYFEVYDDPTAEIPWDHNVIGIATSWPARLGIDLRPIDQYRPTPKPLNFALRGLTEEQGKFIDWNIKEYRRRIEA
jgi:hypothetical protein